MKYIKVTYVAPRCTQLNEVEYYVFNDRVTEEEIEKFLKDKRDELECEIADFLIKACDYTAVAAIFAARVNVDWDFIDVKSVQF
jgi:hypothetical protein